jgi:hypothetical protein
MVDQSGFGMSKKMAALCTVIQNLDQKWNGQPFNSLNKLL